MTLDEQRSLLDVPAAASSSSGVTTTCADPVSSLPGEASTGASPEGGRRPALPTMARHKFAALDALVSAGRPGLTDFQLADITHVKQPSIGKRRGDLVKLGFVEQVLLEDGRPEYRPSDTGAPSTVWRSTPAGYERWLVERGRRAA